MNDYKEYLEKQEDGTYALVLRGDLCKESDILVPDGAEVATACGLAVYFWKPSDNKTFIDNVGWSECDGKSICTLDSYLEDSDVSIIWQRAMVNPMKEYLDAKRNYEFVLSTEKDDGFIEIPEGAVKFIFSKENANNYHFTNESDQLMSLADIHYGKPFWYGNAKNYMNQCKVDVLWQREQDDPFLTPETTLNEQYAEKDNVNHPSHYTKGKVECLDALESATIGKTGIEAVCVANVIKYLWRYEEKNGLEDVKKAQFYLNRLLSTLENNNG